MHALYGFARYADEIVDDLASTLTEQQKADWLRSWGEQFFADLRRGRSDDPVCRAVVDTVQRWDIPVEHFEAFLHSMTMDLTVTEYATYDDLYEYVYGSAAVIGLQMVPILEPSQPEAYERAKDLGVAFQLANFVRDVGEDLDRGRVYLPLEDLARFGVTRADLEQRVLTPQIRAALEFQIARVRRLEERVALRHRDAAPVVAAVHRGRTRPLLRHRRRGRGHRLPGLHPAGHRLDRAAPRRRRCPRGAGPARLVVPTARATPTACTSRRPPEGASRSRAQARGSRAAPGIGTRGGPA